MKKDLQLNTFKTITINVLLLFILIVTIEGISLLALKYKYKRIYKKNVDSFLYKAKIKKSKYRETQSTYYTPHPLYGVKFTPNIDVYGLSADENGFPVYIHKRPIKTDKFGYIPTKTNGLTNIQEKEEKTSRRFREI